ncbi:hypothetical protein PVBG_00686 [Plasmodium vivax Brazil I]|uniref:Uncharacterized protein n=1 Tax=Plasmodium vivax (strain Brazil I) TaxID=1033975 RepID=A0A0J9SLJ3_PLAV1|nr:hypothetical protein PVBG_00686 [Plasmodium vivax Brazil I]
MEEETSFLKSAVAEPCDEQLCVEIPSDGGGDTHQGDFVDIASEGGTPRSNDKEYFHGKAHQGNFSAAVNLYGGDSDRNVETRFPQSACATEKNNPNDGEDKRGTGSSTGRGTHHKRDLLLINIYLSPENDTSAMNSQNNDVKKILSLVKQLLMRRNCAERSALISYGNELTGRYYHISNNEKLLDVLKKEDIRKKNEISFDYIRVGKETEKYGICGELKRNGEVADERGKCKLLTNERCDSFTLVEGDHLNRGGGNYLRQLQPGLLGLIGEKPQTVDLEEQSRKDGDESENAWDFLKRPADRDETCGGTSRNGNGHSAYAFELDTPRDVNLLFKEKQQRGDGNSFGYFQMGGPQRGSDGQGITQRGGEVDEANRAGDTKETEVMCQTYRADPMCEEEEARKGMTPQNQTNCVEKANECTLTGLKINERFTPMEGTLHRKDNTSDKQSRSKNDVEIFREGRNTDVRVKTSSEVPCAKELSTAARKSGRKKGTQLRRGRRKNAPTERGGITKGVERGRKEGSVDSSEKVSNEEMGKMEETIPSGENEKVRHKRLSGDCTACALFYKIKKGCIYADACQLIHSGEKQSAPRRKSKRGKRKTNRKNDPNIKDKWSREGPPHGSASNRISTSSNDSAKCTSTNIINRALTNRLKSDDNEELISYILETIKREESANNLKIRKEGGEENGSGGKAHVKSGSDGGAPRECNTDRGDHAKRSSINGGDTSRCESVTKKEKQQTRSGNASHGSLAGVRKANEEEFPTHSGYALFPHQTDRNHPKCHSFGVPLSRDEEEKDGMKKGVTGNTCEGYHPGGNLNNTVMCNWLKVVQKMGKGVDRGHCEAYEGIKLPPNVEEEEQPQQRREEHFTKTHRRATTAMKNKMKNVPSTNTHDEGVQTEGGGHLRGNSDLFKKECTHYIDIPSGAYGQLGKFFQKRKNETEVDPKVASVKNIHTDRCSYHVGENSNQGMLNQLNLTKDPKIGKEDERGVNIYSQMMGNDSHKCIYRAPQNDKSMEPLLPRVVKAQTETEAEMKFLHSRGKGRNVLPKIQQNRSHLPMNAWRNRMVHFKDRCDNPSCYYTLGGLHQGKENVASNIHANYRRGIYPGAHTFGSLHKIGMTAPVGELLKRESYTYDEFSSEGNRTNYAFLQTSNVNAKQIDTLGGDKQNGSSGFNSAFNTKGTSNGGVHQCRRNFHQGGSQQSGLYQGSAHHRKGNHSSDYTMRYHRAVTPPAKGNENEDSLVGKPFLQRGDPPERCLRRERKEFIFSKKSSPHRTAHFSRPAKDPHYRMLRISMENYKNGSLTTGSQNGYFQVRHIHCSDGVVEQHIGEKKNNPVLLLSCVKICKICGDHHVRSVIHGKGSEDIGGNLIGNPGDTHNAQLRQSNHFSGVTKNKKLHKRNYSSNKVRAMEKSIDVDPANVKEL